MTKSKGNKVSLTAGMCCQYLEQRRGRWLCEAVSSGSLELQDALTTSLQNADLGLDPGERLCQVLVEQSFDWLSRRLAHVADERVNLFQGQPQGAQAFDHPHTAEGFFPKEAVVALAAAPCGEEPQILVGAQEFDRHTGTPRELSDGHGI